MPSQPLPVIIRPRCDGGPFGGAQTCATWPTWKIRHQGDSLDRNWQFACGRHLHQMASEQAADSTPIELVRIRADD